VSTGKTPRPPVELAARVGSRHADDLDGFDEVGTAMRDEILAILPGGWSFDSKKVLDFGCGVGRTLRYFLAEAEVAEIHGCDLDEASIRWLDAHLSPPLRVFRCGPEPPLPFADGSLDLIWAISVFTHVSEAWARWLLELHRALRDGGLLIATFMGRGQSGDIAREPWDENRVGMNVLYEGQPWEQGGPMVLHSPWWIREHWGRAFEVLTLREDGFVSAPGSGQGIALLRKRAVTLTPSELERVDPSEPREVEALRHNIRQLHRESLAAREAIGRLQGELAAVRRTSG
jgi:SAM-dependent methyltransferase